MVVYLQFSGMETHNAIGKGARYYYPFRIIFEVTKAEYNKLAERIIQRMSIKANNGAIGPNRLLPSLIVFGTLPDFSCKSSMNAKETERFEALMLARAEIETIIEESKNTNGTTIETATSYKIFNTSGYI